MKIVITFLLITCLDTALHSQNGSINGFVLDSTSNPIENVTVKLSIIDSKNTINFKEGTITDELGQFVFINLSSGTYLIEFSHVNYNYFFTEARITENQSKTLSPIILSNNLNLLDEIVISGKKLPVKQTADKIIINVESNVLNSGGTATDILKQLSVVNISTEGNVSIRGKSDIEILIDGKPSGLAALQGQRFLSQIDLSTIERIEVITNPSVIKSGSGSGGIINIIKKKNIKKGLRGMLNIGAGTDEWYHISPQLSYRSGAVNLFINYTYRHRKRLNTNSTIKGQLQENVLQIIDENQHGERIDKRNNFELGLDYFITENKYFTFSGNYRNRDKTYLQKRQTSITQSNVIIESRVGDISEPETNEGWGATAQYKSNNDNSNKLNILLDYVHSVEDEDIFREELVSSNDESLIDGKQSFYIDINDRYMLDVENEKKVDDSTNITYGAQSVYRRINQTFRALELNNNTSVYEDVQELDDTFNYDDIITSLYSQIEKKYSKWYYEAAIRFEWFNNSYSSESTNETFNDSYFKLFPSIKLGYDITDKTNIVFSSKKGINRPSPNRLNPFPDISNAFNISIGNPKLSPEIFYSSELGVNTKINKLSFTAGLFFTYYKDMIQQITELRNDGITYRFPINLDEMFHYGLDFSTQLNVNKWWRQQIGGLLYNRSFRYNSINTSQRSSYQIKGTSTLNLSEYIEMQFFGSYNSPESTPQGELKSMYYIDIGLEYNFLNKKAKLSLLASDIFNTLVENSILFNKNLNAISHQKINTQRVYITFNYKF